MILAAELFQIAEHVGQNVEAHNLRLGDDHKLVAAFDDGGRYGVFTRLGDGRYKRQETFVVKRLPDRSYEFINEEGKVLPISFHDIGDGLVVGQAKPRPDRDARGYLMLMRDGNDMLLHAPQCKGQDAAVLKAFGVERRKPHECVIDRVSEPAKLFAALKRGQPVSKMVPE